jgi:hypothetical protein
MLDNFNELTTWHHFHDCSTTINAGVEIGTSTLMLYLNETTTGDESMFSFDPVEIEGKADNQTVPKSRNGMATDLKRAQETAQTA